MIHIHETESTNKQLRSLLVDRKPEEGTVVWCDTQTAGRGQQGNSWESEPFKNLTFSFLLYPEFLPITEQFLLSEMVALALVEELEQYAEGFTIKWPNDIYWKEKKIAGILIENDLMKSHIQSTIVGIGLNLNQTKFVSNAPNPVSLSQITGDSYDREPFLKQLMSRIYRLYLHWMSDGFAELSQRYLHHLYRRNGLHTFRDEAGEFQAEIVTVEPTGHLLLRTEEGELRSFAFKEVAYCI